MKKTLAILLTFAMILFLFSCSKNNAEVTDTTTEAGNTTTEETINETTADSKCITLIDENGSTVCADYFENLCSVPTTHPVRVGQTCIRTVPSSLSKGFQVIRTQWKFSQSEYPDFPYIVIIESSDELKKYIKDNENTFDFSRKDKVYADTTIGFLDAVDKYDDEFFRENSLIIAVTAQPSGSIRYNCATLAAASGGKLYDTLILEEFHPHEGTDDCADWHIIVEAEKGTYADKITLQVDVLRAETPEYLQ